MDSGREVDGPDLRVAFNGGLLYELRPSFGSIARAAT
jgi:hypothetical protein